MEEEPALNPGDTANTEHSLERHVISRVQHHDHLIGSPLLHAGSALPKLESGKGHKIKLKK